jgi:hypothetical protein
MMTRRTFLGVVISCAAASAAGWQFWRESLTRSVSRGRERILALALSPEQRLRAHFPYLQLEPDGVRQYLADYRRHRQPLSGRSPLPEDFYTQYLLSTDFFRWGADESRPVHYVAFADPYVSPCRNPLARPPAAPHSSQP